MSADNLVLVVLRGENARHRVVSVAHISLAAAIIFTPALASRAFTTARITANASRAFHSSISDHHHRSTVRVHRRARALARPPRSSRNPKPLGPVARSVDAFASTASSHHRVTARVVVVVVVVARTLNFAMMPCEARRVEADGAARVASFTDRTGASSGLKPKWSVFDLKYA